jgi:hypothetical protein
MIRSLEDAWNWYIAVRTLAYDMKHLAGRCDKPEWDALLRIDNAGRDIKAERGNSANPRAGAAPDRATAVVRAAAGSLILGFAWARAS